MGKLLYLNLGCGITYHKDWTNIDFVSNSEYVLEYNLLKGIPEPNNKFTLVYHSHVLEHFPKAKAVDFIKECYRVLKPGGVIRVAIPDLERIALNYIKYLNESIEGVNGASQKYEWTMLELFDQIVRTNSGGDMVSYIKDISKNNDSFLLERNGQEVKNIMDLIRKENNTETTQSTKPKYTLSARLKDIPHRIKRKFIRILLGEDMSAYQTGVFRSRGEIHQWMYDRYSLKKMLEELGFKNVQVKTAFESYIPEWETFNLDGSAGIVRKPDSLFIEAIK